MLTEDKRNFEKVRNSLIGAFEVQEEPHKNIRKTMASSLDSGNLTASMQAMGALYRKEEFNKMAKYGLLKKWAMKVK